MARNTFILILILGIFAAIVVGVNLGKKGVGTQTSTTTPTPTVSLAPTPRMLSYNTCGISFSYPDTLQAVDIETGGVTLVQQGNSKESIVVVCQKDIPRVPLTKDKIESVKIGSVSANLYHDASQKDGTPIDKLIFLNPKIKKDIYIAGYGDTYKGIISTITIN